MAEGYRSSLRKTEIYDPTTKLLIREDFSLYEWTSDQAIRWIGKVIEDFDFQTPGDRSRAIAALLTPALKLGKLITGPIPAVITEADKSQSGKTFLQKLIAASYNESLNPIKKSETGVGSLDESFGTALLEGRPFIQFDNIRGKFDLQSLESFLTGESYGARPAYSKTVAVDPSKFCIMINSNGYHTTTDLANRSSIIRIKYREEYDYWRYQQQGGNRGGILEFLRDYRAIVLSSIFKVISEWHSQGKQRTNEKRHHMREWCQILDWIVQNIFHEAPLMGGHEEAKTRVSNPDMTFLRGVVLAIAKQDDLDTDLRTGEIFEACQVHGIKIHGLSPEKKDDQEAGAKMIGIIMGRIFSGKEEIILDSFKVERCLKNTSSGIGNMFPTKMYRVSPIGGPGARAVGVPISPSSGTLALPEGENQAT